MKEQLAQKQEVFKRECEKYMPQCQNKNCNSCRWTVKNNYLIYVCTNCGDFKSTHVDDVSEQAFQEIYQDFLDNEN